MNERGEWVPDGELTKEDQEKLKALNHPDPQRPWREAPKHITVGDLIAHLQTLDPFLRVAGYYNSGYHTFEKVEEAVFVERLLDHGGYLDRPFRDEDKPKAGDWLVLG